MPKNQTIDLILKRRSHRQMSGDSITPEDLDEIVKAMNAAPTSSNKFHVSALVIKDPEVKEEIFAKVNIERQKHYLTSAITIVFMIDFNRIETASKVQNQSVVIKTFDNFLNAWGDAYIMLQNAVIAAESLGYNSTIVGGVRHFGLPVFLQEKYNLPENVFPVIAVNIGKSDGAALERPRLNRVYIDKYDKNEVAQEVKDFDAVETKFWKEVMNVDTSWTKAMVNAYAKDVSHVYTDFMKPLFDPHKDYPEFSNEPRENLTAVTFGLKKPTEDEDK
ncbi:hypothetical protein CJJ23_03715 [Mycoplasmopsis agassizii]|uniref:Nitroreductase domain-containing protein n=1 Tax=Mycoplasmopsis agassizii TaxID=33922 RepID=A0A269THZ2_9BACT|nr:nitroreductase family protein [Mycoplasmopsis agassizii]PAK21079.1 hypothetical protein CJJ23_03715 [Mycoplasmopsis agassizii]